MYCGVKGNKGEGGPKYFGYRKRDLRKRKEHKEGSGRIKEVVVRVYPQEKFSGSLEVVGKVD